VPTNSRPTLVGGPYFTPRYKLGQELAGDVIITNKNELIPGPHPVRGLTDAPIPWPYTRASGTRWQLIVTEALAVAIRTESVLAVMWYWRVSRSWVEGARRTLEVPRMNEGTRELWRELAPARLGDPRRHRPNGKVPRKLTDAQVTRLRRRAANGERSVVLAEEYGVTRQYVRALVTGDARPDRPG
jgi:hypothetical protein